MLQTRLLVSALLGAPLVSQQSSNILVSTTFSNTVREFTAGGGFVGEFPVPHPSGQHPATEYVRDLAMHPSGDLYVFNGTFAPYLSVRRAASGQWEHYSDPRWATVNNVSYGGIALFGNSAFVPDSFANGGLFRFDLSTFTAIEFGTQFGGFFDVTVGWDGDLYALATDERTIQVFDPTSLAHLRTIQLQFDLSGGARGLGVDQSGQLFVSTWGTTVRQYDPTGNLLKSIPTGSFNHQDLDLDACGTLLFGHRFGNVYRTDTSLGSLTGFPATLNSSFVAFAAPNVPAPAVAAIRAGTPANPQVFSGPGALLGTTWSGTLLPFLPGAIADVVAFGAGPANAPSPFGTILFDELLTYFLYDAAAGGTISVLIPNQCQLNGLTFVAQGCSVSLETYALANALDVRISSFQ